MGNVKRDAKITLHNVDLGSQEFTKQHAENILNAKTNNGLWVLPKGSKYALKDGELIRSSGTSEDTNAQQQA